jgi:hypothetical protein
VDSAPGLLNYRALQIMPSDPTVGVPVLLRIVNLVGCRSRVPTVMTVTFRQHLVALRISISAELHYRCFNQRAAHNVGKPHEHPLNDIDLFLLSLVTAVRRKFLTLPSLRYRCPFITISLFCY